MERVPLERELETRIEALGYELVDLETAGSKTRPLLRLRIDRPGSEPGKGVTVDDCTRVSRALQQYLDEQQDLGDRYVLEVSSPGIERPLVRSADYERFAGREVAVKARNSIGEHGKRVEGVLLGLQAGQVRVELPSKEVVAIPEDDVVRAHLVFRWGSDRK
jgi:ribosome maturation factor RimP